jgi:hypothetical protein
MTEDIEKKNKSTCVHRLNPRQDRDRGGGAATQLVV